MSQQKYTVKMEELPDQDMASSNMRQNDQSMQEDHGSWSQVDNMEKQARNEKLHDANEQMKTAHKVAHLVEKDIHQKN